MRLPPSAVALASIALAIVAACPLAGAQRGVSGRAGSAPHMATAPSTLHNGDFAPGRSARNFGRRAYPYSTPYATPYASLPFPFLPEAFENGDIYSTGYPVASQPPPYLVQAMQAMTGRPERRGRVAADAVSDSRATQPLMIELQNGHYVQVNSAAVDGEAGELNANPGAPRPVSAVAAKAPAQPPAILIFRDGHSEEVRDYTIASGVLYARGNFYTDGFWNKKIDLASLDVPQTLEANANRNVQFILPLSANEVITRF